MNRTVLLLFLYLVPAAGRGQAVNFEDGFEDGDFTSSPAWEGDAEHFRVTAAGGGHLLQLDSPDTEDAFLSTPSASVEGYWEIYLRFDGFLPSASNRAEIFLMSDTADLEGPVNGYALQAGQSGDDFFKIVRYDGGVQGAVVLEDTTLVTGNADGYRIRVERSAGGEWGLFVARGYLEVPVIAGAPAVDATHLSATHFGVRVRYTSTRSDRFYFDFKIDPPPFSLETITAQADRLELRFSREVDPSSVTAGDFTLTPDPGNVPSVDFPSPETVALDFPDSLASARYGLRLGEIRDVDGQAAGSDTLYTFMIYGRASPGELLLNEFAWDPPGPAPEFVEIINAGPQVLNLAGWRLGDSAGDALVSGDTLSLFAGERLALTSDSAALASAYPAHGPIHPVPSLAALNNSGDALRLISDGGWTADSLSYSPDWGGVDGSLERRSHQLAARFRENWGAAPGSPPGSPGRANAVAPDTLPPEVNSFRMLSGRRAELLFSERLESSTALDPANVTTGPGPAVSQILFSPPDTLLLELSSPLRSNSEYTFSAEGLCDLFGNCSARWDTTFRWRVIETARKGALFLNEFAYDPPAGWSEYVELYNGSDKTFSAGRLTLEDDRGKPVPLSEKPVLILPGAFLVIAPDEALKDSFPGITLLSMGSAFPALNNAGDRIVIRNEEGGAVDSLRYGSGWGGREAALERRSLDHPAGARWNWAEAPGTGGGTPGSKNRAGPDTEAPRLAELHVSGPLALELIYTEELAEGPAGDAGNYRLEGGSAITAANLHPPDAVLLYLEAPLLHKRSYTLRWSGVSDHFGNASPGDTAFIHIDYPVPAEGELLVSEFMYDPPEGWTEYVELYNASGREMSVAGISLSDSGGRRAALSDSMRVLGAGEYLVLAPDETLRELYPGIPLASLGSRFPALNNGGDRIVIRSREGEVLDSLRYRREWGGVERAMERRSFSHPPTFGENWAESDGPGTPGRANGVGPDTTPPRLLEAEVAGGDAVSLLFSERLDEKSVSKERFRFTPGRAIGEIRVTGDSLALHLDEPLESGTEYQLAAEGLSDLFGNLMEPTERSLLYIKISPAGRGDLVLSEFLHLPEEEGDFEFVEVHNRSEKNVELSGWSLEDAVSSALIRESLVLRAGRRVVLTSTASPAGHYPGAVRLSSFPSLNNSADRIALRDGRGRAIDSLSYGGREWAAKNGRSMERKDPLSASGDPANWEPSRSPAGHTAGIPNSVEAPDREPPRMLFARLREGALEVDFNEFVRPDSLTVFRAGGLPLAIARYLPERANRLTLRLPGGEDFLPAPGRLTLAAENLGDYRGNRASRVEVPIAFPPLPGDLAINEIMYRPIARPGDHIPDQSEYVELWNTSGHSLSLEGLRLRGEGDENGRFAPLLPARSRHRRVAAGSLALLYADTAGSFGSSRTARYFRLEEAGGASLLRFDRLTLGLGEGGVLVLADSSGAAIDSVPYSPEWHNPALADNRGISLEKIDPALPGHRSQSWGSSAAPLGGTPLEENSIYAGSPHGRETEGLTLAPDPFSPDGDGYEDHLLIGYRLNRPDYLIRVRIYDRYGRLVRTLADGRRAGSEGSLVWDGLSDERRSNRIGIYIVILEAYNAVSGARQAFRKTAVLARRLKSPWPFPR